MDWGRKRNSKRERVGSHFWSRHRVTVGQATGSAPWSSGSELRCSWEVTGLIAELRSVLAVLLSCYHALRAKNKGGSHNVSSTRIEGG